MRLLDGKSAKADYCKLQDALADAAGLYAVPLNEPSDMALSDSLRSFTIIWVRDG